MTDQPKDTAETPKAEGGPNGQSQPAPDKVETLASDALEAGRPIAESETGRKAIDAADKVFDKAGELTQKALDSEVGRKVSETASGLQRAALDTGAGRKAEELGRQAMASEAGETAKKIWNTPLGRNVGVGAAAGAAIGIVIPFVGPIIGAVAGGGLGYLRSLSKKT